MGLAGFVAQGTSSRLAAWCIAYGNESVLREAEACDQPYLTKLRLTKNVKDLIKQFFRRDGGKRRDKDGKAWRTG